MADWKPIDSAPKDKPILVYGVCDHWDDSDEDEDSDHAKPDVYIAEWVRDEYCDEEYWAIKESDCLVQDPTHWSEVPDPPKEPITITAPAAVDVKPIIVTSTDPTTTTVKP